MEARPKGLEIIMRLKWYGRHSGYASGEGRPEKMGKRGAAWPGRRVNELFISFKAAAGAPCPIGPRLAGAGLDTLDTGRLLSNKMFRTRRKEDPERKSTQRAPLTTDGTPWSSASWARSRRSTQTFPTSNTRLNKILLRTLLTSEANTSNIRTSARSS
jgi:hypothetical protein